MPLPAAGPAQRPVKLDGSGLDGGQRQGQQEGGALCSPAMGTRSQGTTEASAWGLRKTKPADP